MTLGDPAGRRGLPGDHRLGERGVVLHRAGTDRPAGDIYLALARAMGVQVASFGSATNPLTEILT